MAYQFDSRHHIKRLGPRSRLSLLGLALVVCGLLVYGLIGHKSKEPQPNQPAQIVDEDPEAPSYTPIDLQPIVDSWVARQAADYHIVVYDLQAKKNIATHKSDTVLFAASLYKQYVTYLAMLDIQKGIMDPNEILIGRHTRKECIDRMIRSSDSSCGEAMMSDMGQASLNQRLKDMGMTGTFFNGIRTSAADAARILQYISEKRDLNDANTAFLLDAMRTQDARFKRGLATGAPEATWETKVGWNEDVNYHDIGIMTLPDGRKFVVAILGQGSGASAPIADFAKTIYDGLTT